MSNRPATIRQSEIARAVKGVRATGLVVTRVEVEGGRVVVYTAEGAAEDISPLEAWRRSKGGQG